MHPLCLAGEYKRRPVFLCACRADSGSSAAHGAQLPACGRRHGFRAMELFSHVIASPFLAKQSPVDQASLTAWGLLRRKERSSQ